MKELLLFGGEYYNGSLAVFYNDLFVYNVDRDDWRKITSPNSPLPRSGHAWCRGGNQGGIYLFGGEFSSPKQGTFYHYNDFWRLDPSTREWTRVEHKGKSPPARSGHRLTYYKNNIILFGGFQDTSSQTRYLQDLWIYDCQNFVWHEPALPPATQKPEPRSSFSFHPHESGAVLYGGYSRVKTAPVVGKQTRSGSQASKSALKPMVHQDTWFLRIAPPPAESSPKSSPSIRWERRKKPANAPNPPRAGATQAYHKGRGITFGGVHDVEESEEGIESEFFNQMFALNLERNRFFPLTLRRSKLAPKRQIENRGAKRGRGRADEAELLANLAALDSKGANCEFDTINKELKDEVEEINIQHSQVVLDTMPHPRFNAQLAVQGDVLYIFGGTYENGDREYTFDDLYAVDLGKLDGVREVFKRELDNWMMDEVDSDSESADDENEDEEDEDMDDGSSGVALTVSTALSTPPELVVPFDKSLETTEEESPEVVMDDDRPHPRPFETLREFFARTSTAWQEFVLQHLQDQGDANNHSIKELRRIAFEKAEAKWWDSREEITAEEERQEEAGIGEVVSIAERNTETGGVGKRR